MGFETRTVGGQQWIYTGSTEHVVEIGEGISPSQEQNGVERAMGFEPTTSCLGSKHSTPELRPLVIEGEHSIYL